MGRIKTVKGRKIVRIKRRKVLRRTTRKSKPAMSKGGGGLSIYSPFKNVRLAKLVYNDVVSLASTAGGVEGYSFSMNGIYDVDLQSAGHQPRYYDTFLGNDGGNAPYGQFLVYGVKIRVTFINTNSSVNSIGYIGLHGRTSTSTGVDGQTFVNELPNTKYAITNVSTGVSNFKKMSAYFSVAKIFGVKDLADDDDAKGTYASNPPKSAIIDLFYQPIDGATTATIKADVSLVYYVKLFDLNQPNYS